MKKITLDNLPIGKTLSQDLFSQYGVKLLPRGMRLSESVVRRLSRVGEEFYLADDIRGLAKNHLVREVDPGLLKSGMKVPEQMLSLGGRLIYEAGELVEDHHLDLISFGLFEQQNHEPSKVAAERRLLANEIVEHHVGKWDSLDDAVLMIGDEFEFDECEGVHWPCRERLIAWREERVDRIRGQFARMLAGLSGEMPVFELIVDELMGLLRLSPSRFSQIALLCPQRCDYLPDHAMSTAVLSMLIAVRENYSCRGVQLAGLTGLLHDTGMLLIPSRIRMTNERSLSEADRNRILIHPAYSLSFLAEIPDMYEVVRCAAYRHHERDNGSGYPCGLKQKSIGDLPRLIAVSDVAAAVLGCRPFRDEKLPHDAITELAGTARAGLLSRPMIRYLIDSIGLYPVGSFVRLSTGEGAQVIGNHAGTADRPIVRVCDRTGSATRREIDLSAVDPWEVSILTGISGDEAGQRMLRAG